MEDIVMALRKHYQSIEVSQESILTLIQCLLQ